MNSSINSNSHLRPRKYGPPLQHSLPARQCLSTTAPQDHPIWTPFSNSSCFTNSRVGGWESLYLGCKEPQLWTHPEVTCLHSCQFLFFQQQTLFVPKLHPPFLPLLPGLRGNPFISCSLRSLGNMHFLCDLFANQTTFQLSNLYSEPGRRQASHMRVGHLLPTNFIFGINAPNIFRAPTQTFKDTLHIACSSKLSAVLLTIEDASNH